MDPMPFVRARHSRDSSLRSWRTALGLVIVALPLALGGAHVAVNAALAVVLCGTLAALVWRRGNLLQVPITLPLIMLGLALAWTLVQLVPLPLGVIAVVSPKAHELLTLGGAGAWSALSLDVPATAHEALKLVAYLAAAVLAAASCGRYGRERELFDWIGGAGALVALLGLLHALAGLKQPYGSFGVPHTVLVSSFINPNHLAGFLGFASLVAIGSALEHRGLARAYRLGGAVLSGAGVFLSLSRGGILAFVFAVACFAGLVKLTSGRPRSQHDARRSVLWVQSALAAIVLLAGYVAYGAIVSELWTLSTPEALTKTAIWKRAPELLRDFPVAGLGRGAFGVVHPHYLPDGLPATLTHLENEPLQAIVDWGPLVGIGVLLLAAASFVLVLLRAPASPPRLAAASALVFVSLHNLADFNLELSAVALPVAVLLTVLTLLPGPRKHHDDGNARSGWVSWSVGPMALRLAAASLAAVTLAVAYPALAHELGRDTERLRRLTTTRSHPDADFIAAAEPLVAWHPADYLLPFIAGEHLLGSNDGKEGAKAALPWINRGLYLAPGFAPGHKLAARALLQLGARSQSLLEYRMACEKAPWLAPAVVEEVWRQSRSAQALLELTGTNAVVGEQAAAVLLRERAFAEAVAALDAVGTSTTAVGTSTNLPRGGNGGNVDQLSSNGGDAGGEESARLAVLRVRALIGQGALTQALALAEEMKKRWPHEPQAFLLAAQAQEHLGDATAAQRSLDEALAAGLAPQPLLATAAELALRKNDVPAARRAAEKLLARSAEGPQYAHAQYLLAQICVREGRAATALRHLERARDAYPGSLGYRLAIAQLREALNDIRGARSELERARLALGESQALSQALERLAKRDGEATEAARRETLLGQ